MKNVLTTGLALAACAMAGTLAFAAIVFDNEGNPVFVGKGDIQSLYGWNNNALQQCANYKNGGVDNCLEFRVGREGNVHWRCQHTTNQSNIQSRSTTLSEIETGNITGRQNNQVTGFHIQMSGVVDNQTSGDPLHFCPSNPNPNAPQFKGMDSCLDNQGNLILGCSLVPCAGGNACPESGEIGQWGTGGTDALWVRDIRPGFDNDWYALPLD